jgi:hypothetical protein
MPEAPAGDDVRISNTGQRIRAILVLLIAIGVAGAAIWWWQGENAKKEAYQKVLDDLTAAHNAGWVAFWKATKVPIEELKTNDAFALRVKDILSSTPVAYGKHVQEQALPLLEKSLEKYSAMTAPGEMGPLAEEVGKAAKGLFEAWKLFAAEFAGYEEFLVANGALEASGNAWLGAQQDPANDKFKAKAINYTRLAQCILADSADLAAVDPQELGNKLEDTCATDRPGWFRRVKTDCLPKLNEKNPDADDTYTKVLETYRKAEMPDTKSVFGIATCIREARAASEAELIESIAVPWAEYLKAKNALIQAVKEKQKS